MFRIYALIAVVVVTLLHLSNPAAAQVENGIPVLLYHHVSDDSSDMPELTISATEFERQMRLLQDTGFQTISLAEFLSYMKGEQVHLPEKPVVITFDDGYADNYTSALPILEKFRFKAALFMVGINFDRDKRLSRQQIREMAANGFSIEGHSMTHPDLTTLSDSNLRQEVSESKKLVEQVTHKRVDGFAYPGGFYNLATLQAVESVGYQCAFTVLTGLNRSDRDNIFLLRRIPVFRSTDFDKLAGILAANQPKTSLLEYDVDLPQELQPH
jgi:peptidoglycan/xylan/chitin deacetylase (PgdA/CDA1 family)